MNYSNPKFWKGINVAKIKDVCYKGLSKPVRAVKQFCPNYFDGIKCWKEAMVEQTVQEPCPDYVIGFDLMKSVSKTCGADGVWLDSTNYTGCLTSDEDQGLRNFGHYAFLGAYSFASFIMVLALLILLVYRKNVHWFRVMTYVNYFLANLFKDIMSMIWYITVIRDPEVLLFNPIWCQMTHNITNYSNLATHFWLFAEALHIYLAAAIVQSRMKDSLFLLTFIGWIMPAIIVAVYSMTRIFYFEDTESCWTGTPQAFFIISTFNFFTLIISVVLLIKVLYFINQRKKRFPRHSMVQTIKSPKASLILIPLFVVQDYLLLKQQSRQYALDVSFQIFSAVITITKVLISAITFYFNIKDVVTSFNNHNNGRQEEPQVDIAMTDMSGFTKFLLL